MMLDIDGMESQSPTHESTAAIVVTYAPDHEFDRRLDRVRAQVSRVIVVDNYSTPEGREAVRRLVAPSVEVIENACNEGIGTALNQGVMRAVELGYRWALTLDQDTVVDPDIVSTLLGIAKSHPQEHRIGIVGANARSVWTGRLAVRCLNRVGAYMETRTVITSGTLLSIPAYSVVGPFRADFFIEGVDLEYCLRLRRHGYLVLLSCRALMTHAAGRMEERTVLGRTVLITNHAPWRYYYLARNLRRIFRLYGWQEPSWVFTAVINVLKTVAKVALFEENRLAKFRLMFSGALGLTPRNMRIPGIPEPN